MTIFHCQGNFILKPRFYLTLQFRETMHFLPCVTFAENRSNRSSGVQIMLWDICTRFGCCLYSTEWSWIINNVICIKKMFYSLVEEHLDRKNCREKGCSFHHTRTDWEKYFKESHLCFSFFKFYRNVLLVCISLAVAGLGGGISLAPIMPDLIRTAR